LQGDAIDFLGSRIEAGLVAAGDEDFGASFAEHVGGGFADAGAASGDDDFFVVEIHGVIFI
jgi:hypothetical protein